MVKYYEPSLDRTFAALADPTRRALLAQLGEQQNLSVSELARPFAMSLPAIMKHLDVLAEAGLITRTKTGRTVACQLMAAPMEQAVDWLNRYQRFWSEQLDRLAAFVEEDEWPPSPASPSNAGSTPRRRRSSAPGRTRKKMRRWWGPERAETLRAEADARVGGRFRVLMRTSDGEEHEVSGVYREVVRNAKLVFTWAWRTTPERESLVTVALEGDGAGTRLTLTHEQFFDEAARDGHRSGWTGAIDKLEAYLA